MSYPWQPNKLNKFYSLKTKMQITQYFNRLCNHWFDENKSLDLLSKKLTKFFFSLTIESPNTLSKLHSFVIFEEIHIAKHSFYNISFIFLPLKVFCIFLEAWWKAFKNLSYFLEFALFIFNIILAQFLCEYFLKLYISKQLNIGDLEPEPGCCNFQLKCVWTQ